MCSSYFVAIPDPNISNFLNNANNLLTGFGLDGQEDAPKSVLL